MPAKKREPRTNEERGGACSRSHNPPQAPRIQVNGIPQIRMRAVGPSSLAARVVAKERSRRLQSPSAAVSDGREHDSERIGLRLIARTRRSRQASSRNQKSASVPGPACAPMTAPSVTTSSSSAFGRCSRTSASSSAARSGAAACATPSRYAGSSSRLRLERRRELGERLPLPAHALHRLDLSVADREDRLDLQQRARRTRPPCRCGRRAAGTRACRR